MTIRFEAEQERVSFISPLHDMQLIEETVERRKDPLTGKTAILSTALEGKGPLFFGASDLALIQRVAEQSRSTCFFCPENLEGTTPRYPEDWLPGGALRIGECFLFPNLFPIGAVHAVVALGKKHYRSLDDFPPELLRDGLKAGFRLAHSVIQNQPTIRFFTLNANYLFPAGASLVHPHLQLLGGRFPATTVLELIEACHRYKRAHDQDSNYFVQLLEIETQQQKRMVGQSGPVQWLTPFAPIGTNEVLGVLPDYPHWKILDNKAFNGLAIGLSRVLAFYQKNGFSTFNFTIYSADPTNSDVEFPVFLRVICRQNVYENYRSDDYFVQKLLGEELILTTPEQLASELRDFWSATNQA